MISITEEEYKIIREILKRFAPDSEVRVFGSRYKGNHKKYSDLDIAIVSKEGLDFRTLYDIKEAFQESELNFRVDVLDWNSISEEFKKVIEKGYEVIK